MRKKRNILKKVLCCALAACMGVALVPAQAFASADRYVSEVRMAYGSDGAKNLEAAGYTVVSDSDGNATDINGGTKKDYVYMGYKTTTDVNKAITDIAIMDMKGGYSIADYDALVSGQRESTLSDVQQFWDAVLEFRANVKAGAKGMAKVKALLNNYWEDDLNIGMGDFLLDEEKCTQSTLAEVFLQSNSTNVVAVQSLLSKGCASDWATQLPKLDVNAEYDSDLEADAEVVFDQFSSLRSELLAYNKSDMNLQENDAEDVIEMAEDATDSEVLEVVQGGALYDALKSIKYGDGTLYDLVMLNPKKVESFDAYYPIVSVMTKGQRELMPVVGFKTLILDSIDFNSASDVEVLGDAQEQAQSVLEESEVEHISMYEGVNRELFKGSVGLTSDTKRAMADSGDRSMFCSTDLSIGLYVLAGAALLTTFVLYFKYKSLLADYAALVVRWDGINGGGHICAEVGADALGYQKLMSVAAVITCIITVVNLTLSIYNYYHPDYYDIPNMMVNRVDYTDDDGVLHSDYVDYSVVKLLNSDTPGDTNAKQGMQWNCIYTTTNKDAGDPILADSLVTQKNSNQGPDGYSAIHMFGETAAFNTNSHTYTDIFTVGTGSVPDFYVFYDRDEDAYTGSAFANGYVFLAAGVGLVVGVIAALAVSAAVRRNRRKEAPVTA